MKLVPETTYRVVNDDGSEVHSATAQKVNDIVQLMKDSKVLGNSSPVSNNVGMRIASAILNNYELRKKRESTKQETEEPRSDIDPTSVCAECGNYLKGILDNEGHEPDCNQRSLGQ